MKELKDKLQQQENELKDTQDRFTAYREEMNDTEVRIESLTVDLELAEEKVFLFFLLPYSRHTSCWIS